MATTWTASTANGDSKIVLSVLVLIKKPLPDVVGLGDREWLQLFQGFSFAPAQHVLLVIETSKEVCEEICEERDNFSGRRNNKHAAQEQENLEIN